MADDEDDNDSELLGEVIGGPSRQQKRRKRKRAQQTRPGRGRMRMPRSNEADEEEQDDYDDDSNDDSDVSSSSSESVYVRQKPDASTIDKIVHNQSIKPSQTIQDSVKKQATVLQTKQRQYMERVKLEKEIRQAEIERKQATRNVTGRFGSMLLDALPSRKRQKLQQHQQKQQHQQQQQQDLTETHHHDGSFSKSNLDDTAALPSKQPRNEAPASNIVADADPFVEKHDRDKCYLCLPHRNIMPMEMQLHYCVMQKEIANSAKNGYPDQETASIIFAFQESTFRPEMKKSLSALDFRHFCPRMSERAIREHLQWMATATGETEYFISSALIKLKKLWFVCMERTTATRQKLLNHEIAGTLPPPELLIDKGEITSQKQLMDEILTLETIFHEDRFSAMREKSDKRNGTSRLSSLAAVMRDSTGIKIDYRSVPSKDK